MTPDEIRAKLAKLHNLRPKIRAREFAELESMFGELRPAAVLAPLTEQDGRLELILTKRSEELRKHSGEVSFPGGRMDDTDADLVFTALRETHEEIAIRPQDVSVFGALMSMPTVTGYDVTVYVGEFASPYDLVPNPAEIDTIIRAPLDEFPRIHRVEEREWNGYKFPMHYYDWDGHVVWGATAYMLNTLLEYLEL